MCHFPPVAPGTPLSAPRTDRVCRESVQMLLEGLFVARWSWRGVSPLLDSDESRVINTGAPDGEADGIAHRDRRAQVRRRCAEARRPRGQEATDLLVRDHHEVRVDGTH